MPVVWGKDVGPVFRVERNGAFKEGEILPEPDPAVEAMAKDEVARLPGHSRLERKKWHSRCVQAPFRFMESIPGLFMDRCSGPRESDGEDKEERDCQKSGK